MKRQARTVAGGVAATFLLSALAVLAAGTPEEDPPAQDPPAAKEPPRAIVLVTIDTLREDHVGYRRPGASMTPYLDTLAREGVYLAGCRATSSWTPPSMASIFTSLHPLSHGVVNGVVQEGEVYGQTRLAPSLVTLAELLKQAGYLTVGVPSNLHLQAKMGFDQGFDAYWGEAGFVKAPRVNQQVEAQLAKLFGPEFRTRWKERKTFLWVHYFDPHDPYFANEPHVSRIDPDYRRSASRYPAGLPMPEIRKRYTSIGPELARLIAPLYGSEVAYVDDHLRALSASLGFDDPGVLLMVTSDHGEELVDHGDLGHARTLYEEMLRVPLVVRWPGRLPRGAVVEAPTSILDVLPTLVELAGGRPPASAQGRSLVTALRGVALPPVPHHASLHDPRPELLAVRDGDWKLVLDVTTGNAELFDLATDPRESRSLAAAQPDRARRMKEQLLAWRKALPAAPPSELVPVDESVREQMEAVGYVGGGR